jgi:hypothetical protein
MKRIILAFALAAGFADSVNAASHTGKPASASTHTAANQSVSKSEKGHWINAYTPDGKRVRRYVKD